MTITTRRVVTANENGRSVVSSDGIVRDVHDLGGGMCIADIWKALNTPVDLSTQADMAQSGSLQLLPPANGNVLRIADFPPETPRGTSAEDARKMFEQMSAGETATGDDTDTGSGLMHKTETLDYGSVLAGEITLQLDDDEVDLKAGDIVIQRGTNHGWVNRSNQNCRMLFILIDGTF